MSDLVRYDAMCNAIAECYSVDELKDYHDKALALSMYAKQAQNTDAERKATAVRIRAETRLGELFKEMQRTPPHESGAVGGNAKAGNVGAATVAGPSEYRMALETSGISERTARRYQELAEVPRDVLEKHLLDPVVIPTTNAILKDARTVPAGPAMDECSLWVWGRLRDFERLRYGHKDAAQVMDGMTDTMRADVQRILPAFMEWASEMMGETINA